MLAATLLEVKRNFLITEISILYSAGPIGGIKIVESGAPSQLPDCVMLSAELYRFMKIAALFLLLAGWLLVLAAVVLLRTPAPQAAFVLAGLGVEALGVGLLFRSHAAPHGRHE
ncbi:MAG: hypothetical protein C5B51_28625 [Terriglobia bacterium]|nr:MAG: hypothetical protein C5B51_28625 [Terriglobia bacterium]